MREVSAEIQQRTRIRFQEKAERDRQARLNYAERKGRSEAALAIARNLLDVLDDATIAAKTGLDLEQVAALRALQGR